jgi:hypothetical protein
MKAPSRPNAPAPTASAMNMSTKSASPMTSKKSMNSITAVPIMPMPASVPSTKSPGDVSQIRRCIGVSTSIQHLPRRLRRAGSGLIRLPMVKRAEETTAQARKCPTAQAGIALTRCIQMPRNAP